MTNLNQEYDDFIVSLNIPRNIRDGLDKKSGEFVERMFSQKCRGDWDLWSRVWGETLIALEEVLDDSSR